MTDDQILLLVDTVCPRREYLRTMSNQDLIAFAQAVAQRTLRNQKAKWYQEGVEAEREACAKIVDAEMDSWSMDILHVNVALNNVAAEIRARGE